MSQYDKILNFIKRNGSITPMDAFGNGMFITKLSTRIGEMERKGILFDHIWESKENGDGDTVRYMRYFLRDTDGRSN